MAHLKKILSEVVHEIIKAIKLSMLPCKVLTYIPTQYYGQIENQVRHQHPSSVTRFGEISPIWQYF